MRDWPPESPAARHRREGQPPSPRITTQTPAAAGITANPTLTAVTTRSAVKGAKAKPWFGTQRANQPSNVRIQLSSPNDGAFSAIGIGDWSIKTVESVPFGESFSAGPGRRDVLVYVHGFNQTFETAALDAARLSDGLKFSGDTMLFSWPSKNSLLNYIYDRESALWSRDALEDMLDQLLADSSVGTIHIVAHSMGTMVTVEALRQLYDRRAATMASRIGAVVLASPDIDMDGFKSSITRVGGFSRKITVLTVANDRPSARCATWRAVSLASASRRKRSLKRWAFASSMRRIMPAAASTTICS